MDKIVLSFRRFVIHPFFAFLIPFFVTLTISQLYYANTAYPLLSQPVLLVFAFVFALLQSVSSTLLENLSRSIIYKIFELGSVIAISCILGAATKHRSEEIMFIAIVLALVWVMSFVLHRGLKQLETVEKNLKEGRSKQIKDYLQFQSFLIKPYNQAIRTIQSFFFFLFGSLLCVMILVFYFSLAATPLFFVFYLISQVFLLISFFYINLAKADLIFISEGLSLPGEERKSQFYALGIFVVIMVLIAVPLSLTGSMLPVSIINLDFLSIKHSEVSQEPEELQVFQEDPVMSLNFEEMAGLSTPGINIVPILTVIGIVALLFISISGLYRLIIFYRPVKNLKRIFTKGWLQRLMQFLKEWQNTFKLEKKEISRTSRTELRQKIKENRQRTKFLLDYSKAFETLVKWGRKNGCPYSSSQTIKEYALSLSRIVSNVKPELSEFYKTVYQDCFAPAGTQLHTQKRVVQLVKVIVHKGKKTEF